MTDEILMNQTELAKALNVSRNYIRAMKISGFAMPGGKSTKAKAMLWLDKNPKFSVSKALAK